MRRRDRAAAVDRDERARADGAVAVGRHWFGRADSGSTSFDEYASDTLEDEFDALRQRNADDGGVVELLVGNANDSAAIARWKDQLSRYVEQQGPLDALRLRSSSEPPWPATGNPMIGYLIERSIEIADADDLDAMLAWLAANAWFEGVIAERARIARLIDEE